MLQIENSIISFEIFEKKFVCNLDKCKGACCIEGDAGAPLENEEIELLEELFPIFKSYMSEKGIDSINLHGVAVIDDDGEYVTPLINGAECAYTIFENGIAKCAIEKAFLDGKIEYRKPISCHLYPIRISKFKNFEAVNYHIWPICEDARVLGNQLNVPVYKFLENPLVRKYNAEWYNQLKYAADNLVK